MLNVRVSVPNKKEPVTFDCHETKTVGEIKEILSKEMDRNIEDIRLVYAGKEMIDDNKPLNQYNYEKPIGQVTQLSVIDKDITPFHSENYQFYVVIRDSKKPYFHEFNPAIEIKKNPPENSSNFENIKKINTLLDNKNNTLAQNFEVDSDNKKNQKSENVDNFNIYIKTSSTSFYIKCYEGMSIKELKQRISLQTNVSVEHQRLIFLGKEQQDDNKILQQEFGTDIKMHMAPLFPIVQEADACLELIAVPSEFELATKPIENSPFISIKAEKFYNEEGKTSSKNIPYKTICQLSPTGGIITPDIGSDHNDEILNQHIATFKSAVATAGNEQENSIKSEPEITISNSNNEEDVKQQTNSLDVSKNIKPSITCSICLYDDGNPRETIDLTIDCDCTIDNLKQQIYEKNNYFLPEKSKIYLNNTLIENSESLNNIIDAAKKGEQIKLQVIKVEELRFSIKLLHEPKYAICLELSSDKTVSELKQMVYKDYIEKMVLNQIKQLVGEILSYEQKSLQKKSRLEELVYKELTEDEEIKKLADEIGSHKQKSLDKKLESEKMVCEKLKVYSNLNTQQLLDKLESYLEKLQNKKTILKQNSTGSHSYIRIIVDRQIKQLIDKIPNDQFKLKLKEMVYEELIEDKEIKKFADGIGIHEQESLKIEVKLKKIVCEKLIKKNSIEQIADEVLGDEKKSISLPHTQDIILMGQRISNDQLIIGMMGAQGAGKETVLHILKKPEAALSEPPSITISHPVKTSTNNNGTVKGTKKSAKIFGLGKTKKIDPNNPSQQPGSSVNKKREEPPLNSSKVNNNLHVTNKINSRQTISDSGYTKIDTSKPLPQPETSVNKKQEETPLGSSKVNNKSPLTVVVEARNPRQLDQFYEWDNIIPRYTRPDNKPPLQQPEISVNNTEQQQKMTTVATVKALIEKIFNNSNILYSHHI